MKYLSIAMLLLVCCCRRENKGPQFKTDEAGTIVSLPYLWSVPISYDNQLGAGVISPIVYKDRYVLCPGAMLMFGSPRGVLHLVDAQTGELKWRWNDYQDKSENSFVKWSYIKDNLFVNSIGSKTWVIDLNTGKTVWKRKKGMSSATPIAGIGDYYYYVGITPYDPVNYPFQSESKIYRGRVSIPETEELVVPASIAMEKTDDPRISGGFGAGTFQIFTLQQDTMLVVDYSTPTNVVKYGVRSKFGVFNVTKRIWLYKDIEFTAPEFGLIPDNMPIIYQDKVYHTIGHWITCHELLTGKEIWKQRFKGNFLFGGFVIENGVLVANCEDLFLYGLDPATGTQKWKEPSSGTAYRMFYMNGVVYYSGGGDGHLHAVDVETGKHIWRLNSPEQSSSAFFYAAVAGIPGTEGKKGTILAHTGLRVLAYEAAR